MLFFNISYESNRHLFSIDISHLTVKKTYRMIESCDPTLCSWSEDGDMFIVVSVIGLLRYPSILFAHMHSTLFLLCISYMPNIIVCAEKSGTCICSGLLIYDLFCMVTAFHLTPLRLHINVCTLNKGQVFIRHHPTIL